MRNIIIFALALFLFAAAPAVCFADGWERTYGGSAYDKGYSVAQTSDGGYIVAGRTYSFGAGGWDVYLVKTDSLGFAAIEEPAAQKPIALSLTAYPNPFNSSVKITLDGVRAFRETPLHIAIYDLRGNVVYAPSIPRSLSPQGERDDATVGAVSDGQNPSPSGEGLRMRGFTWTPAQTIASGLYLIRATVGEQTITKRAILMK